MVPHGSLVAQVLLVALLPAVSPRHSHASGPGDFLVRMGIELCASLAPKPHLLLCPKGMEMLLKALHDWDRCAHRGVAVKDNIKELSDIVLRWRRLELLCWPHIFTTKQKVPCTAAVSVLGVATCKAPAAECAIVFPRSAHAGEWCPVPDCDNVPEALLLMGWWVMGISFATADPPWFCIPETCTCAHHISIAVLLGTTETM